MLHAGTSNFPGLAFVLCKNKNKVCILYSYFCSNLIFYILPQNSQLTEFRLMLVNTILNFIFITEQHRKLHLLLANTIVNFIFCY